MKIALVGAGRVATNLAPALQQSGAEVVEVWSKSRSSAEALADRIGCKARWAALDGLTREADLYVIAVKDAVLTDVISQLHVGREDALMVHTAGSMPLSVFADAGHRRGGVFYPMQTFSKERAVDFSQVHFFVEAALESDVALLTSLASALTGDEQLVHRSTSAMRRRLHLAAVFACNFVNHCYALSAEVLAAKGLPFSVMLPLVDETAQKVHELAPKDAQTGPAVRGDQNVMQMQANMLAGNSAVKQIYESLSSDIQRLADND